MVGTLGSLVQLGISRMDNRRCSRRLRRFGCRSRWLFFVWSTDVRDPFFWVGQDSFLVPEGHVIHPHGWHSLPIHLGTRSWWCALVPCDTSLFPRSPKSFRLWRPTCSCNGPPLCSASVTSRLCSSVPRRLPSTHHRIDPTLEMHRYPSLSSVFFLSISSLVGWDRPDRPSSATSVPLRPLSSIPPLPFGGPKDGARRGPQGGVGGGSPPRHERGLVERRFATV